MLRGTDKLNEFPEQFNQLEAEVKKLSENTKGIKIATWVTAISTVILALVGLFSFLRISLTLN